MNKEKLKKIKVLYYPYKAAKKIVTRIIYYIQYIISLFYISKNAERVKTKIAKGEVLNVVFVVQYIPGWNKLEPIYSKMQNDYRFNPIIVCVPLNIKDNKLMDNGNDTYQYFVEHGYTSINALLDDGNWFDLRQLKPDYLFHSRPYNSFMPDCYTSGKIVKYALICNVLYGTNTSKNAQKVTLNKDYFIDNYCYFAFDELEKKYFEREYKIGICLGIQKCLPYGTVALEQILNSRKENASSSFRKCVLWTPRWSTDPIVGGSNFFKYRYIIKKLIAQNPDVLFVIRPHPLMFGNFLKTGEMSAQDVQEFKEYCCNTNNVYLDENKEYSDTFWNSDILITDNSGIVPEYFITSKPIIFCHSDIFVYTKSFEKIIQSCYQAHNSEDIEHYFNLLIGDVDIMKEKRMESIRYLYKDVSNTSTNIINSLAKVNKQ